MKPKKNKFFFFDRDGTIIKHVHHLQFTADVIWVDKLFETLKSLSKLGFSFGLVTNQSVISRGMMSYEQVQELNRYVLKPIELSGLSFKYVLVCPHVLEDNCACRKPKTGLVDNLVDKDLIDFQHSFMVGDQESDVEFGEALGMQTIRICSSFEMSSAKFRIDQFSEITTLLMPLR